MAQGRDEPVYSIRIAARLVGLHVQTLRYYERSGLVNPQRSPGNVRYYSDQDVAMIQRVKSLVDDLGVNLAGVEVILRMNHQMAQMEAMIRALEVQVAELTGRRSLSAGTNAPEPQPPGDPGRNQRRKE